MLISQNIEYKNNKKRMRKHINKKRINCQIHRERKRKKEKKIMWIVHLKQDWTKMTSVSKVFERAKKRTKENAKLLSHQSSSKHNLFAHRDIIRKRIGGHVGTLSCLEEGRVAELEKWWWYSPSLKIVFRLLIVYRLFGPFLHLPQ